MRMRQTIHCGSGSHAKIGEILAGAGSRRFMLVCDSSYQYLNIKEDIDKIDIPRVKFDGFSSNPQYNDVCRGVELFRAESCDAVVAVGGGSSMDVAKCIKLFSQLDPSENFLTQIYKDSDIPLIAVPTTAGTGSESTRFAVIYFEGKKQSVTHGSIVPDHAILDPDVLKTLPLYQKKCTMLDALCQGIESWWSVNSTDESRGYSMEAIEGIMRNMDAYIKDNSAQAAEGIMLAANYSGRAINITQTTAAHAMSYKLTSMYGLPHGHAVAVCLPEIWDYMIDHIGDCSDERGAKYLETVFRDIAHAMGYGTASEASRVIRGILGELEVGYPESESKTEDIVILAASVNPVRLGNNPVRLGADVLSSLYGRIVGEKE